MDEKRSLCKMTRLLPSPYLEAVLYQLLAIGLLRKEGPCLLFLQYLIEIFGL